VREWLLAWGGGWRGVAGGGGAVVWPTRRGAKFTSLRVRGAAAAAAAATPTATAALKRYLNERDQLRRAVPAVGAVHDDGAPALRDGANGKQWSDVNSIATTTTMRTKRMTIHHDAIHRSKCNPLE
jgi:hypothetical protein